MKRSVVRLAVIITAAIPVFGDSVAQERQDHTSELPNITKYSIETLSAWAGFHIVTATFVITLAALVITAIAVFLTIQQGAKVKSAEAEMKRFENEQKRFENAILLIEYVSGIRGARANGDPDLFLQSAAFVGLAQFPEYHETYIVMREHFNSLPKSPGTIQSIEACNRLIERTRKRK